MYLFLISVVSCFAVDGIWIGTVDGLGAIDLGLTESDQIPGTPLYKPFSVMYYDIISGEDNFDEWEVTGIGRAAAATVSVADGVVTVNLDLVPHGTVIVLR